MFVATTLGYAALLAVLCVGAGLIVDRLAGGWLPASLLPAVGAAALIGLSQLSTCIVPLAPATPYLLLAVALAGVIAGRARLPALLEATRRRPWPALAAVAVYALALAPVLASGRPSFSSYLALADSAVHMLGADFLVRHGQSYSHLDLRNSYGRVINAYYNAGYPSGADTFFGASALLVRLPLIWCFQPFNAFMLACASGPLWRLARRAHLPAALAALAAVTSALAALDYAYELLGSVKEITALAMILALGALAIEHRAWLFAGARAVLPFALLVAAGTSALGVAFAAWALVAMLVLAVIAAVALLGARARAAAAGRRLLASIAAGLIVLLAAALPTWRHLSGSLRVAREIASTSNSGNLRAPLRAAQVLGVWLRGSYKLSPLGAELSATHVLMGLVLAALLLGALQLLRVRSFALAGWLALMAIAWLAVSRSVTTWAEAKTLMITSPAVVLLAWAGTGVLASLRPQPLGAALAGLIALAIAGGVLASDALQYHTSNLAPTARYEELASIDSRFANRGPALFTDFDEWSLYVLRDLDIGGPDFIYSPPALAGVAAGNGYPVDLDRASPAALAAYPLIITRRNPTLSRPPAAYRLVWRGRYYEVWSRDPRAAAAISHTELAAAGARRCMQIAELARAAPAGSVLSVARAPVLVRVALSRSVRPRRWGHARAGLVMSTAGTLRARFSLPRGGAWNLWVQGQIMPSLSVSVDGRRVGTVRGEIGGNSLVVNVAPALRAPLAAGAHELVLRLSRSTLAPGDDGAALLASVFLTPASAEGRPLLSAPAAHWRALCAAPGEWVELAPA